MKKVILAFSGGLDTSFSVPYLQEQGYEVITVTVDTGGFTAAELKSISHRAKELGVKKHYQVDGKRSMYEQVIAYVIKTNGLYQKSYPNMCTDRYIIAEETIKVAKKEGAQAVAHGSSSMGNDQVRFDVALGTLAPQLKIVTPIREMGGNREKEQQYLKDKGFAVAKLHKKYSVNQNILGVTYSGSEIDALSEPDEEMFLWTKLKKTKPLYLTLSFSQGLPTAISGKKLSGVEILQKLNVLSGEYGFGRDYYTGDCVIGIKGHIVFEAPGILTLIKAHLSLEQLTLTKPQQTLGAVVSEQLTDLMYTGKLYEPLVKNLHAFIDSQQQTVSGEVTVKLTPQQIQVVALKSPFSLINAKIATYAQKSSWTSADAEGFIKLFGLQSRIAAQVKPNGKGKKV